MSKSVYEIVTEKVLDSMRKMADKKEGWNFYFDRNQIPTMKKIVKMMLAP